MKMDGDSIDVQDIVMNFLFGGGQGLLFSHAISGVALVPGLLFFVSGKVLGASIAGLLCGEKLDYRPPRVFLRR